MALINKIRERSGIAIGLVAVSMILFIVGGDLLGPNSMILGSRSDKVGEIAGVTVKLDEYQNEIEQMKYSYQLNTQRNPTDADMYGIRNSAWEYLIVKLAFQKQYDKLGLQVTDEEVVDMVQGANVSPELKNTFVNQEGQFDRSQIINFLKNINQMPPEQQAAWYNYEKNLQPSRLRLKYENLIALSSYVTKPEAQKEYEAQSSMAEVKYLYIPYYSVPDSAVKVTDDQLQEYLNANADKYEATESRSIDYVVFPISPSKEDSIEVRKELAELKEEFKEANNDSIFARLNTDGGNFYNTYNISNLPENLKANVSNLSEGDVRGPYPDQNAFHLYKVSSINEDTVFSIRASHILIAPAGQTDEAKAAAKTKAESLLAELRSGADFAQLATENGMDGTRDRGGDLGWFSEGRMVKPFEDAVFGFSGTGLINRVVETEHGYHLIKVTEPKTKTSYKIALITREVAPSDETRDRAFKKADLFVSATKGLDELRANAKKDTLNVFTAENIDKDARGINNLSGAREAVRWLYNEASKGDVSPVFEIDNNFIVAAMTAEVEEGTVNLKDVRAEVEAKVKNQQKAKIILDKIKGATGDLESIAQKYGADANVYTMNNLNMASNVLNNAGAAPVAIGKAFGLKPGGRTDAIEEENGVVIVELITLNKAPEIADYTPYKEQLQQARQYPISQKISDLIKEKSDIKDYRYKFF